MLVQTTKGALDDSQLEKRVTRDAGEESIVTAIEYWLEGELVHRSIHAELIGRDLTPAQQPL